MPLHVSVATERDAPDWDTYVSAHPAASGYHGWAWRQVFERAFGHRSLYLVARRNDRIAGVLPLVVFRTRLFGNFAVSLPFVNYGGVLADCGDAAGILLIAASEFGARERLSHIELRHRAPRFPHLPSKSHKVAMLLDLAPTPARAWELLDRKVRNQVRKAEKSGLVPISGGCELLDEFYDVFARNMRDLGTPVYHRRFFDEVLRGLGTAMRVTVVRQDAAAVAAGISYRHGEIVEVPWASSLKEYLALCPNNLLYWHIIEQAITAGARTLDFGRSTPDEGTYRFKAQWGARAHGLCWEYQLLSSRMVPDQSPKNPKFKRAISIWKHLPVGITTLIGPRIVRAIP